jgi:transcriptional regulator with GAF, ATPase, and Fis domain
MVSGNRDEKATLPEPSSVALAAGSGPALALTILFHPDVSRVGERALLGPLAPGTAAQISRHEPSFSPPGGGAAGPLDSPHVSRSPIEITALEGGAVALDAAKTSTSVVARGKPLTSAAFSADDVRRGVVLLLAGSVVLLLHRVASAPLGVRGEELGLVGDSDGLRAVLAEVRSVADLSKPVLLRGESGSGKELVARAIHRAGPRRGAPFVAVNLGAVPAPIAAAELFGSERGAFTGAVRRRGYFEQAEGGTLFLDEIGEAPVELQAALLRALQEGEIQPVGGDRPRKVDARVVAATDADLEARVEGGSFRAPLLNRLAAYQIWIPPLRERKDDIGRLLVRFFREELMEIGEERKLAPAAGEAPWLSAAVVARLAEHPWPGNVRQLRNVVRHLVIGNRDGARVVITPGAERLLETATKGPAAAAPEPPLDSAAAPSTLPSAAPASASSASAGAPSSAPGSEIAAGSGRSNSPPSPRRKAIDIGKDEILAALRKHRFEIAAAAKELGIPRPSLDLAMSRLRIRKAADLRNDEIEASFRANGGDILRMVDDLQASERALLRRVRELGLGTDLRKPDR